MFVTLVIGDCPRCGGNLIQEVKTGFIFCENSTLTSLCELDPIDVLAATEQIAHSKYRISFRSKNQTPLFMFCREDRVGDQVVHGECLLVWDRFWSLPRRSRPA